MHQNTNDKKCYIIKPAGIKTLSTQIEGQREEMCFNNDLKCAREGADLTWSGKLFHKFGATTAKA